MTTEAQIRASVKHNRTKDAITLRITKEEGAQVRQAAADAGQTVTAYIMDAVRERLDKDK